MPLLNLKTNLKSLKYGQDQPGGGDSRQPYIKTDINTVDTGFNRLRLTKFDDGLIRGGVIGALNSSVVDTLRIGKFFLDAPKGPLFIVKQIGLQLSGPRLESKQLATNNPTSGQGFLNNVGNLIVNVANKIVNAVGPTRIYNLGINTLAQVPLNAFGGHVVRHGLLPVQNEDTKYINVVQNNNQNGTNRLLRLSTKFKLGDGKLNDSIDKGLIGTINQGISNLLTSRGLPAGPASFLSINQEEATIDDYLGGSSSVYGIGKTLIKRYDNTEDVARIDPLITYSNMFSGVTRNSKGDPEPVKIKDTRDFLLSTTLYQKSDLNSNGWTYKDGTSLNNSFLSTIAKDADKHDINKTNQQNSYNDANNRAKNKFFYGASNYSSSIYASGSLQDNSGIPTSLDYRIASIKDTQSGSYSNTYAGNSRDSTGAPIINSKVIRDNNVGLGVSKQYFFSGSSAGPIDYPRPFDKTTYPKSIDVQLDVVSNQVTRTPDVVISPSDSAKKASYQKYQDIIDSRKLGGITYYDKNKNEVNAFGIYGVGLNVPSFTNNILPNSTGNIVYYNGNSLLTINKAFTWSNITRELRVGSGRQDEINLTPIFNGIAHYADDTPPGSNKNIRDLAKFRIQAVNTDGPDSGRWMVFRAYITNLSDDTTPEWTDVKYAGRGDKFYIYNGFTRKINVTFQVAALSEGEMRFIYQKLNFLMGNAMPDYNNNLMRGPLVRMSIGNWIDCQLGKLDSVSLKPVQDSPWEIALDEPEAGTKQLILPHVVEVTLGFTPIGSETRGTNLISEKSETTSHIAQNNTGADADTLQYIK